MGLWKLHWRSLGVYRGAKSVQAEWKAADKRQAAAPANKHSGEVAPQDERWRDASASRN